MVDEGSEWQMSYGGGKRDEVWREGKGKGGSGGR